MPRHDTDSDDWGMSSRRLWKEQTIFWTKLLFLVSTSHAGGHELAHFFWWAWGGLCQFPPKKKCFGCIGRRKLRPARDQNGKPPPQMTTSTHAGLPETNQRSKQRTLAKSCGWRGNRNLRNNHLGGLTAGETHDVASGKRELRASCYTQTPWQEGTHMLPAGATLWRRRRTTKQNHLIHHSSCWFRDWWIVQSYMGDWLVLFVLVSIIKFIGQIDKGWPMIIHKILLCNSCPPLLGPTVAYNLHHSGTKTTRRSDVCAPVIPLAHHDGVFPYNHHFSFILANCPVASLNREKEFMTIRSGPKLKVVNINLPFSVPLCFWYTYMTHIGDEKQSQTASHPHLRCDSRCLTSWHTTSIGSFALEKTLALRRLTYPKAR